LRQRAREGERERERESTRKMCSGKSGRGGRNNEDKYGVRKKRGEMKRKGVKTGS